MLILHLKMNHARSSRTCIDVPRGHTRSKGVRRSPGNTLPLGFGVVLGRDGVSLDLALSSVLGRSFAPVAAAGTRRKSAMKTAGRCKCFETGRWEGAVLCCAARVHSRRRVSLQGVHPIPSCGLCGRFLGLLISFVTLFVSTRKHRGRYAWRNIGASLVVDGV